MNRIADIERFYSALRTLQARQGIRKLSDCHGRMSWPNRGVYFFFEEGEFRENGQDLRVVRIGTHAVSQGSKTSLWNRLRGHKGTNAGGGNHRGSIFRLHVGSALIQRKGIECITWGTRAQTRQDVRALEHSIEMKVSQEIGAMPIIWVDVDDAPGTNSARAYIERNAIALLSNAGKEPIDPPSKHWLGRDADHAVIGRAGLWNVNHIEGKYDPKFICLFAELAARI